MVDLKLDVTSVTPDLGKGQAGKHSAATERTFDEREREIVADGVQRQPPILA